MTTLALEILKLHVGSTTIDMMDANGVYVLQWEPTLPQPKGGGNIVDPLNRNFSYPLPTPKANVAEVFDLAIVGSSPTNLTSNFNSLKSLLDDAIRYWSLHNQVGTIGYIEAKFLGGTTQYAEIRNYQLEKIPPIMAHHYLTGALIEGEEKSNIMQVVELGIERGHWGKTVPGSGNLVTLGGTAPWEYASEWTTKDTTPANARALLVTSTNEYIIVGETTGTVRRSTDGGDTWSTEATVGGQIEEIFEASNGSLYLGSSSDIYRSTDEGDSWSIVSTKNGVRFAEHTNGKIFAGQTNGKIAVSDDNGDTWSDSYATTGSDITRIILTATGRLLASTYSSLIVYSDDGGDNWLQGLAPTNIWGSGLYTLESLTSGRVIAASPFRIYISDDDGDNWEEVKNFGTGYTIPKFLQLSDGRIFLSIFHVSLGNEVWLSEDNGSTFRSIYDDATTSAIASNAAYYPTGDKVYIVIGDLLQYDISTIDNPAGIFISNRTTKSNINFVKTYDSLAYTDQYPAASFPFELYSEELALTEYCYIGSVSGPQFTGKPFDNIVFDIDEICVVLEGDDLAIDWEYYNGLSWASLGAMDNTNHFARAGVNAVCWRIPSDWATVAVDGETGYWIRGKVDTLSGTVNGPTQQNRDIYSIPSPFIPIDSDELSGDENSLARLKMRNVSDSGANDDSSLGSNFIAVGQRDSSFSDFTAYLNASDEWYFPGILVEANNGAAFGDDISSPTARSVTVTSPSTDTSYSDKVVWELSSSTANDFLGSFKAMVRVYQSNGDIGDCILRFQVRNGLGSNVFNSKEISIDALLDWKLVDLGLVEISSLSDLGGDNLVIALQMKNNSGGSLTVKVYDIILLPIDQKSVISSDVEFNNNSAIRRIDGISRAIDIDGLSFPKIGTLSTVKLDQGLLALAATYKTNISGDFELRPNTAQKLWILSAEASVLSGSHDGSGNSSTLDDSTADFINQGVEIGNLVRNTTDDSQGIVTAVAATQITAQLFDGTDNDWDASDDYLIYTRKLRSKPEVSWKVFLYMREQYSVFSED